MTKHPSMPMFWAEFFADTEEISANAAKGYLFLLGHAWLRGGELPNDDHRLARMARLSGRGWAGVKSEILPFWELGLDGMLRNKRLSKEWFYVRQKSEINSKNASEKWGKKPLDFNGSANANALPNGCERNAPTPTPTPTLKKKEKDSLFNEKRQKCGGVTFLPGEGPGEGKVWNKATGQRESTKGDAFSWWIENGLSVQECEERWTMLQERKKLHG